MLILKICDCPVIYENSYQAKAQIIRIVIHCHDYRILQKVHKTRDMKHELSKVFHTRMDNCNQQERVSEENIFPEHLISIREIRRFASYLRFPNLSVYGFSSYC
ncbi:hypothetical protein CEXT_10421 [Caerostris extrusa]|uniref:Uncharacterized protein n=1 Tax=Caerostris extrusa TaxID=172846 RepID=A0AAV4X8J2_CAEEX|nr:hypothetical protein CEXT_10421 [Caerostris extrusa]